MTAKTSSMISIPPDEVEMSPIETWENKHSDRHYVISIEVPEFTSVCPKTGLPDFGTLCIDYVPDELVIELKAFKYYTLCYRNMGIFYENVANKFMDDIIEAINPRYLKITGEFYPRGGISTGINIVHVKPGFDVNELAELI